MGFFDKLKEQFKQGVAKEAARTEALKAKKVEMDEQGIAYCPKCGSISVQPMKKGFSIGKAVVGGVLTGGIGLLAGTIGSKNIEMYCLKCGHKYKS
jgi:uncharacterized OB-fold protein